MAVQAKFFVKSIARHAHQPESAQIELSAVTRGEENKQWSQYTPSGTMTMYVTNPAAAEQFELGKEYLVTFEAASI